MSDHVPTEFIAGYRAALADLAGRLHMQRAEVMYADTEAAARRHYEDPGWLEPMVERWIEDPWPTVGRQPQQKLDKPGTVYVFDDKPGGRVKVGWTAGPIEKRLRGVSTAAGVLLTLRNTRPGTRADEQEIHGRLAAWRLHGEWFQRTPEVLALIDGAAAA